MSEATKVYSMVTYVEGLPTIKKQMREVTREIKKKNLIYHQIFQVTLLPEAPNLKERCPVIVAMALSEKIHTK